MRSVADLTTYNIITPTALVTVRETVYILGGSSSFNGVPSYALIVAISLLDDELHVVTQSHDGGRHACGHLFSETQLFTFRFSFPHLSRSVETPNAHWFDDNTTQSIDVPLQAPLKGVQYVLQLAQCAMFCQS